MTSSLHLYSALSSMAGPALTWYASQSFGGSIPPRQELGAPVVVRWVSKIANLLGTDLADLFSSDDVQRSIVLDLCGTWQEIIWAVAASSMGWRIQFADDGSLAQGDVLVSHGASSVSGDLISAHLSSGADVLLHDVAPLALSWGGDLPDGAVDALEAIMSQPDALVVELAETPSPIARSRDFTLAYFEEDLVASSRVLLCGDGGALVEWLCYAWGLGVSVVVVDPSCSADEMSRIATVERCAALYRM